MNNKKSDNEDNDDNNGLDELGNDRKRKSDGEDNDIGKKKKTTTPASMVVRSKAPLPTGISALLYYIIV
jgi:hypothetical protein